MPTLIVTHSFPWFVLLRPGDGPVTMSDVRCPECGGFIEVLVIEHNAETGVPTCGGIEVRCAADWEQIVEGSFAEPHAYRWCDWGEVLDGGLRWALRHIRRIA